MRSSTLSLLLLLPLGCSGSLASADALGPPTLDARAGDGMGVDQGTLLPPLGDGPNPVGGASANDGPRKLSRRAFLSFRMDDADEVPARLQAVAKLAEGYGGYLSYEHATGATIRVRASELDAFLEALSGQGELLERRLEVLEVTRQYVDLEARLGSAKKTRARLEALLDRAADVEDVLAIEKELARVTSEVESMEAQLRSLAQEVALATVELRYQTKASPGPIGWVFYGLYSGVKWLFVWD